MEFEEAVKAFEKIDSDRLSSLMASDEDLVVFLGRPSCPYCRLFAPKLAQAFADQKKQPYYVNTEESADFEEIQSFRRKHQLKTVPALLVRKDGQLKSKCDSSLTIDQIKQFLAF
ncbi:thioredoxin domain-containing protein [Streptococcus catagoni]|uniref:thioredoxin domain-containing protein n=1 Tax=Streptococcus catagoni TaxID=2654874 RepID=UPI001F2BC55E|nr:thioredoxin domain-containing protein [Streptococcus catagoni]